MSLFLIRSAIALVGTIISTYTDVKGGLILDKVTYPMIALGILFNLVEFDLNALYVGGFVFLIGYLLYFTGKIGGGDVKLFAGITLLIPFIEGQIFILKSLFVATFIAVIVLTLFYGGKYIKTGIDFEENKKGILNSIILGIIFIVYFYLLYSNKWMNLDHIFVVTVPLIFAMIFMSLEKGIRRSCFLKKIKISEMEEGEVVAIDFLDKETSKKLELGFKGILDGKEKQRLEELGVKEIFVYRDMPKFAPFVLVGMIIVLSRVELFGGLI